MNPFHEITSLQSAGLFMARNFRLKLSSNDALSGPPTGVLGCSAIAAATISCAPGFGIAGVELRHQTEVLSGTATLCFFAEIHHGSSPKKRKPSVSSPSF